MPIPDTMLSGAMRRFSARAGFLAGSGDLLGLIMRRPLIATKQEILLLVALWLLDKPALRPLGDT